MKGIKNILLCLLVCTVASIQMVYAKPNKRTQTSDIQIGTATNGSMSVEQEQQFLYYFYEAERQIQLGEMSTAWELLQFCQELNPNDATVNHYIGCVLEALERKDEAFDYLERAFCLEPSTYWYRYALHLLQSGNKKQEKEAIRDLEYVACLNPKDADVRDLLQRAYAVTGAYKKALQMQDEMDAINGYDAMSAMQRYRLNVLMHNEKQAVAEVERYLEIDPDNAQFQLFRMQLYEQTHQPATKMVEAYAAMLRLNPNNLLLMNNLAWSLCISGGDLKEAEQLSRITIMRDPTNSIYLDTYAWIMYHKGDYESALFYIQRAIENAEDKADKELNGHYKAILKKQKK